jgi:hypothetical protein
MTGHMTRSVFERYNIVNECDLVEAAKKLNVLQLADPATQARSREMSDWVEKEAHVLRRRSGARMRDGCRRRSGAGRVVGGDDD